MKNTQIEVKWAIIFIVISFLWMFLEKLFGLHGEHIDQHATYTNLFAIPAIAVYIFALLDKRRNFYHGRMSYKQGFISGLVITLIVAFSSPLIQYITSNLITPEYFPNAIEYAVESGNMEPEVAQSYFSWENYAIQGLIGAFVMGIVTSAIAAIFTRRKG